MPLSFPSLLMVLVLAIAPVGPARGQSAPATAPAASSRPASTRPSGRDQRVVLHINRNADAAGIIALEDDDIITIRNVRGELESFSKARIQQIVRLVDPAPGQTGVVYLNDGNAREGTILEDVYDHVLIEIEGIRAKLLREAVDHVVLQPTVEERYAAAKASLEPGNIDLHMALCRWLFEQKRYALAKKELDALLVQSDIPEASQLLQLVEAQLALAAKPIAPPPGFSDDPDGPIEPPNPGEPDVAIDKPAPKPSGPVYPQDLLPDVLITKQDVNIMRVYEIDFEHPPKVTISPDTVRALIEKYGTNKLIPASQTGRNEMFRAAADRPLDLVRLMFELRARDLYPEIQVNTEPYAMNLFRQRIHDTWLINNCATTQCHGGAGAGGFFLYRKNFSEDRVRYTNLLILERLKLDPQRPLINYDDPEQSLVIQYGLPRNVARMPHPDVPGWKAAFHNANPKMREDAVKWIRAMMQPRPDYPVKFEPPQIGRPKPAPSETQPAGGDRQPR